MILHLHSRGRQRPTRSVGLNLVLQRSDVVLPNNDEFHLDNSMLI